MARIPLVTYLILVLVPCYTTNASVLSSQAKDMFSVNERLYDPEIYSSLYQETSRRKRLYLVPALTKLEKPLNSDRFDMENQDSAEDIPEDVKEDKENSEYLGFRKKASNGEAVVNSKLNVKSRKLDLPKPDLDPSGKEKNPPIYRFSKWPLDRRTLSKLVGRQRKRYKAGVVDRIAHGFGKRSLDAINIDELDNGVLEAPERSADEVKDYVELAKLVRMMNTYRKQDGLKPYPERSNSRLLDDLIEDYIKTNGHVVEEEDGGNVML